MQKLDYPERHHLNFALGWLGLGNPTEAKAEADQISWLHRLHPEVFAVRWRIHARLGNWDVARDLARIFTKVCPDRPTGWLCLSYTLFKLKRPLEAYLHLLHQAEAFPSVSAIPYFLACYAWELGDRRRAGKWLAKFRALNGSGQNRRHPLDHTDLLLHWEKDSSAALSLSTPGKGDSIAFA